MSDNTIILDRLSHPEPVTVPLSPAAAIVPTNYPALFALWGHCELRLNPHPQSPTPNPSLVITSDLDNPVHSRPSGSECALVAKRTSSGGAEVWGRTVRCARHILRKLE
jgi:hypothetical protein